MDEQCVGVNVGASNLTSLVVRVSVLFLFLFIFRNLKIDSLMVSKRLNYMPSRRGEVRSVENCIEMAKR